MSIVAIMETTGALLTVTGQIQSSLAAGERHRSIHDDVVRSLRLIYFTPSRTMGLLARLAEGELPDREEYRDVLLDFNDAEWRVARSLHFLEDLEDETSVSLQASRVLREIAYGKRNLRRYLQELLNEALTFDQPVNQDEAKAAFMCVKSLNSAIEALEAAYNWRSGRF